MLRAGQHACHTARPDKAFGSLVGDRLRDADTDTGRWLVLCASRILLVPFRDTQKPSGVGLESR